MTIDTTTAIRVLAALAVAFAISFAATPVVKAFAQKVGAMDVPGENRRIHDHPIPRLGGLAIFLGFLLSVVLFARPLDRQIQGVLLGAILIVVVGAIDDLISLKAGIKFVAQIVAASIAVLHGVVIEVLMNPFVFMEAEHIVLGVFAIPVTIIWIVAITNSVNLIDGLDGLAVGVSTISSVTLLVISLLVSDVTVAVVMAALAGACIGFMPYNLNPAKIFMGDTGALLLGYVLATMSVIGLFKFYAVVSFAVPLLALAIPLSDTIFAVFRRLFKGQNPMKPDRGHFHHRLLDMGLSQKHAVSILYLLSAIFGFAAVALTTTEEAKTLILIIAFCVAVILLAFVQNRHGRARKTSSESTTGACDSDGGDSPAPEVTDDKAAESHVKEDSNVGD